MLVLARKEGEVIRINDDIQVEVVQIFGDRVRLGITAPKDVPVHREEIWARITEEGRRFRRDDDHND